MKSNVEKSLVKGRKEILSEYHRELTVISSKTFEKLYNHASFKLKIFMFFISIDPPLVSLQLGSTLSNDDIKEGDDVYFECRVEANPKFTKLSWLHNVS